MGAIAELSESQIEKIRASTEHILERIGFRVMHEGVLAIASKAGADVDEVTGIVRIPTPLLRELLALAPSSYSIRGLDGREFTVGGENQHCHAIVTDPWIIDYRNQEPRRPCLEDVRGNTILAQKLDDVVTVSLMDYPVTDFSDRTSSLRALEEHLLHHSKHIMVYAASMESFKRWIEIGGILAQGGDLRGLMSVAVAVLSPLCLTEINGEFLLGACENGLPIIPTICPMAGATSPYGLAPTLAQGNAENIFMAALTQMIRPGHPYLYTVGPSVTDMRSGEDMYYTLDKVLWKVAHNQLARSYNLPRMAECGGAMGFRGDLQTGAEGILFMLAASGWKANILSGIGSCYNAMGMSAEMMLVQTAWLKSARFLCQGINCDVLEKGIESIERVGPGGNFLDDDLTMECLRANDFFSPGIFNAYGDGQDTPLLERAHQKVGSLVTGFTSPVPNGVQEGLRRYFHDEYERVK